MRQIKFRAWDKDNETMRSWKELILEKDKDVDFYLIGYPEDKAIISYDHDQVLMQYTGLKDMKRTEIYESDYVRGVHRNFEVGNLVEVTFLNGCFMFGVYNAHEFFNMHQSIEVIGNIYEHPHLLESES